MKEQDVYTSWKEKYGGYAKDMTLRDHFAGLAMQAYLTAPDTGFNFNELSRAAYEQADAMLKARGK